MQLGITRRRGKRGRRGRPAYPRVLGLSPEQRHERFLEYQRRWQQANRERLRAKRIVPKPVKHFSKRPQRLCAVCLYRVGFDVPIIAQRLRISATNVRRIAVYAGVKRGRIRPAPKLILNDTTIARMILRDYQAEMRSQAQLDDCKHWWKHPECVAWLRKIRRERDRRIAQQSHRKSYQARLAKHLETYKCAFCGCSASALPEERRRFGIKFCSDECNDKAQVARLKSDSEVRKRRRENAKQGYRRMRSERPEVYKAQIRRKLANPMNRIARNHRARLYELIKRGFMVKKLNSLEYFGCRPAFLKRHLESQFKPRMTWENYGKVWHIDHILPLSKFNLLNHEECLRAFNWSNLQPMFGPENLSKSNRIFEAQTSLPLVMS